MGSFTTTQYQKDKPLGTDFERYMNNPRCHSIFSVSLEIRTLLIRCFQTLRLCGYIPATEKEWNLLWVDFVTIYYRKNGKCDDIFLEMISEGLKRPFVKVNYKSPSDIIADCV